MKSIGSIPVIKSETYRPYNTTQDVVDTFGDGRQAHMAKGVDSPRKPQTISYFLREVSRIYDLGREQTVARGGEPAPETDSTNDKLSHLIRLVEEQYLGQKEVAAIFADVIQMVESPDFLPKEIGRLDIEIRRLKIRIHAAEQELASERSVSSDNPENAARVIGSENHLHNLKFDAQNLSSDRDRMPESLLRLKANLANFPSEQHGFFPSVGTDGLSRSVESAIVKSPNYRNALDGLDSTTSALFKLYFFDYMANRNEKLPPNVMIYDLLLIVESEDPLKFMRDKNHPLAKGISEKTLLVAMVAYKSAINRLQTLHRQLMSQHGSSTEIAEIDLSNIRYAPFGTGIGAHPGRGQDTATYLN